MHRLHREAEAEVEDDSEDEAEASSEVGAVEANLTGTMKRPRQTNMRADDAVTAEVGRSRGRSSPLPPLPFPLLVARFLFF